LPGVLLSHEAVLSIEFRGGIILGLSMIISAIVRGIAPDGLAPGGLFVFVGTDDSIEIIVVRRRWFGIGSDHSLALEVPHCDSSLLGVFRII